MHPCTIHTHRQRPELEAQIDSFGALWPEFIFHGEAAARYYHHTKTTFADFNLYLCEWEMWAAMRFPDSGPYVIPGALAPVVIDREADVGTYVEPNVWMVHRALSHVG